MTCTHQHHAKPSRAMPEDQPTDDPVLRLLDIIASCTGGFDEQLARQIEDQVRGEFGGGRIYIARERWTDKSSRDREIRAHSEAGRSLGWLSVRYLLSRSQVRRILAEGDTPPA